MSQIFPEWTNKLPLIILVLSVLILVSVIGFFWYYGSPKYTDVGFRPIQPVKYSHKLHAGDLGIDCRYCHYDVERSAVANVPPTRVCMNCHTLVKADSDTLLPVRESWMTDQPIKWVRVHKIGEYAYFNHSIHINRGVSCVSCHGRIDEMIEVTQQKPLSMGWCLECHRNPGPNLRPVDQVTNMAWEPPADQDEFATKVIEEKNINPPTDCSGCHR